MTALHRELVFYLCDALEKEEIEKPNVLVVGKDSELIATLFTKNYSTQHVADVSNLVRELSENRYDGVIINDVLRGLYTDQTKDLLDAVLKATRTGGFVILREHLKNSKLNLTEVANLLASHCSNDDSVGKKFGYKIEWEQGLRDAVCGRHDWHDHCWLLTKSEFQPTTIGKYDHIYDDATVRFCECIDGWGFITAGGGAAQNSKFLSQLNLKPEETVLDIGSGLGGNAFQIAKDYGAQVLGLDISPKFATMLCGRANDIEDTRVRFMIADITTVQFNADTFDVVYSRGCILHLSDPQSVFENVYKWLKPGGRFLIVDYMSNGDDRRSEKLQRFESDDGLSLRSFHQHVDLAKRAGFDIANGQDFTDQLKLSLEAHVAKCNENENELVQLFSEEVIFSFKNYYQNQLEMIADDDIKYKSIIAEKSRLR